MKVAENAGVKLEREGAMCFITLDRPQTGNCVDLAMGLALRDALRLLIAEPPRVVVLRSSGAHFMVGGDVRRFEALLAASRGACAEELDALIDAVNEAVMGLTQLPCPVLGLISGAAAGFGLSLALACDLLVAAEDASFLMAYSAIGATPDGGVTWHLPRHVGLHRALAIALLNPKLTAHDAKAAGLVVDVVPSEQLQSCGLAIAQRLAAGPAAAQAGIKHLLRNGLNLALGTALEAEKDTFVKMSTTADFAEGVAAFCQRRKAQFDTTV